MSGTANLLSKFTRLAIASLFIFVLLWFLWEPEEADQKAAAESPFLRVSTLKVEPQNHRVSVEVIGTTEPRWPLQLVSAVEGRVKQLPANLEPGDLVSNESLLLEIEPAAYTAALTSARANIAQAELELARVKHEKTVVEQISSNKKLSKFGRFIPHLASAEANLAAAQASFSDAQQRLAETRFVAPFPAIVLDRSVVPGQWVNAGDVLFSLAASDSIDVSAELSSEQLHKLGNINSNTIATISDQAGNIWQAQLRFLAPGFSQQTRQKRVVFYVKNPFVATFPKQKSSHPQHSTTKDTSLSPNATVNVKIKGRELANVFVLPSSVLTPDSQVWAVQQGSLIKESVTIEQQYQDKVYLRFQNASDMPREVVRFPLSTMLTGQKVLTQSASSVADITDTRTTPGENQQ